MSQKPSTEVDPREPQTIAPVTDEAAPDPRSFPPPWNYLIPLSTRFAIWTVFFGILYLLRHFLPLVFLTFVFAYIAEHGVQGLEHRIRSRAARTATVFLTLIAGLVLIGTFLGPNFKTQALTFAEDIPAKLHQVDEFLIQQRSKFPALQDFIDEDPKFGRMLLKEIGLLSGRAGSTAAASTDPDSSGTDHKQGGSSTEGNQNGPTNESDQHAALKVALTIFKSAATVTTIFLLSILFAFLIVKDLPRISTGIQSLQKTKIKLFYDEVASTVFRFGQVLGRFLEAQAVIAVLNTALTAIGMLVLGIPNVAFLSSVVFICSFVPVAGVFISTLPICLEALTSNGFGAVIGVAVMVTIVHMLEAYVFNPMIMGHHLKLNPVLVLVVLVIGHELFGIWGLLLGVPAVTYVLSYAIKVETPRVRLRRRSTPNS